jgi:imidazole glycerol-phosphate synthase subunit HisF
VLKKRIIPMLLLHDDRLVKTVRFDTWRDVGNPVKSAAVYNSQYADELVFLNIARQKRSVERLARVIGEVSKVCFMPVAMGGGVSSADEAAFLILNGCDKVVINSAAYDHPEIITRTAEKFGAQAVIVSIDARWEPAYNDYRLFSDCGRVSRPVSLAQHLKACERAGAGEIMIQSIDRDGTMSGFDIELIKRTMSVTSLPVIGCGGSGNYVQLRDAFVATDVSALACGSMFNFSDSNPIRAKAFLTNQGIPFKVV